MPMHVVSVVSNSGHPTYRGIQCYLALRFYKKFVGHYATLGHPCPMSST